MMQSILIGLEIITFVKMFRKCYVNHVKISFLNKEKM